jgi:hypothetical protein
MNAPAPPPFRAPDAHLERLLGDLFTLGCTLILMLFLAVVPLRWLLGQLRGPAHKNSRRALPRSWGWFEPSQPRPRIARVHESARWPVGCGGAAPSERCHGARVYRVWPGEEVFIKGNEQRLVDTGLRIWAPRGYAALVTPCFVFQGDCAPSTDVPADVRVASLYGTGMLTPEYCDSETLKVWVHNTTSFEVVVSPSQTRPIGYLTFVEASEHNFQKCTAAGRSLWRAQLFDQPAKAFAATCQQLAECMFLPIARVVGPSNPRAPVVVVHHSGALGGCSRDAQLGEALLEQPEVEETEQEEPEKEEPSQEEPGKEEPGKEEPSKEESEKQLLVADEQSKQDQPIEPVECAD